MDVTYYSRMFNFEAIHLNLFWYMPDLLVTDADTSPRLL